MFFIQAKIYGMAIIHSYMTINTLLLNSLFRAIYTNSVVHAGWCFDCEFVKHRCKWPHHNIRLVNYNYQRSSIRKASRLFRQYPPTQVFASYNLSLNRDYKGRNVGYTINPVFHLKLSCRCGSCFCAIIDLHIKIVQGISHL